MMPFSFALAQPHDPKPGRGTLRPGTISGEMAMRNYTKCIFFLKEATGHIIGRAQGF